MAKYGNVKVKIDGHVFDSKKEANRYIELRYLERAGQIKDLELQPSYILQEGFTKCGVRFRPITYRADFRYKMNGETIVEDVKGVKTKEFMIKQKLFEKKYKERLTIIK